MIPTGSWSEQTKPKPFTGYSAPLPNQRLAGVYDFKIGPIELSQSNGRLDSRYWLAYQQDSKVVIRGAVDASTWGDPTELFTEYDEIINISVSFDNLGRPVVFYEKQGGLFLWFYDSQLGSTTVKPISVLGITPIIDFDIKDDTSSPDADIMMYYVVEDTIYYRLQRDRFDIEYNTGVKEKNLRLIKSGFTTDNRFQVLYLYDDPRVRVGAILLTPRVLETSQKCVGQLQNASVTLSFNLYQKPSMAQLKQLYMDTVYNEATLQNTKNSLFTVFQHSGYAVNGTADEEYEFAFQFMLDDVADPDSDRINTLFKKSGKSGGVVYAGAMNYTDLKTGQYTLTITPFNEEFTNLEKRMVVLSGPDGEVFSFEMYDELSPTVGGSLTSQNTRSALRFGADVLTNITGNTVYYNLFPAVFTNVSITYNGQTTQWPVIVGDTETQPVPASSNTIVLRTEENIDATRRFYFDYV